jgi:hypothetical protein
MDAEGCGVELSNTDLHLFRQLVGAFRNRFSFLELTLKVFWVEREEFASFNDYPSTSLASMLRLLWITAQTITLHPRPSDCHRTNSRQNTSCISVGSNHPRIQPFTRRDAGFELPLVK